MTVSPKRGAARSASCSPSNRHSPHHDYGKHANSIAQTFGVEFEFVLVFHESELRRVLRRNRLKSKARIVKKDPLRHKLLDPDEPSNRRSRWPSWALEVEQSEPTFDEVSVFTDLGFVMDSGKALRRYVLEPLLIAKDALNHAGCKVNIVGCTWARDVQPTHFESTAGGDICLGRTGIDYSQWTLTGDLSLIGATKGELRAALPSLVNEHNQNDWDSHGIELVTRVFHYKTKLQALREMTRYLSALHHGNMTPSSSPTNAQFSSNTRISSVPSVFAGTHVHIGFIGGDNPVPIKILQHLAYIMLTHEELISDLHPKHRSGLFTEPQLELSSLNEIRMQRDMNSPLAPIQTEEQQLPEDERNERQEQHREEHRVRALTRSYIAAQEVRSNFGFFCRSVFQSKRPTLNMIRTKVFQKSMTAAELIGMMNLNMGGNYFHRGYIVNWSNLLDTKGKKTIEFRQHNCTLSVPEINQWIEFLFACVRSAERLADTDLPGNTSSEATYADQEGSKYTESDSYHVSASVEDMCGSKLLDLEEDQIHYWRKRYDIYQQQKALYRPTVETRLARSQKATIAANDDPGVLESWQEFDAMLQGDD